MEIGTTSKKIKAEDPFIADYQQRESLLAITLVRKLGLVQGRIEGIRITSLVDGNGVVKLVYRLRF